MDTRKAIIISLPSLVQQVHKVPILPIRPPRLPQSVRVLTASPLNEENAETTRRKRKLDCVSSMSSAERLLNKKMKNRVAAQNSRDKKKARMDQLEELMETVKQQNNQILEECKRLRLENESLRSLNMELLESRVQCSCSSNKTTEAAPGDSQVPIASRGTHEAGPAASLSRDPLQKGRDPRLAMAWQAWCCAWGLMLLNSAAASSSQQSKPSPAAKNTGSLVSSPQQLTAMRHNSTLGTLNAPRKWWGPQQSTWNPMKI